jgi:solute carrier family 29 (equilibrative nucleoside transporter), member 1/2/3
MDRLRQWLHAKPGPEEEYQPLTEEPRALEGSAPLDGQDEIPFSWLEYGIFALLGMAMLWAW